MLESARSGVHSVIVGPDRGGRSCARSSRLRSSVCSDPRLSRKGPRSGSRAGPPPLRARIRSAIRRCSRTRASDFPAAATGARDQSFRLIVRPDIWSRQVRLRLSNAFGTKPVTFDGAFVGLQLGAAAVMPGTNQPVRFGGQDSVTVKPGEWVWSDPVTLPFVREPAELFRPQARRQLPRRRRERADDLAREGPADVLRHGAGRRREGRDRRGGGVPVHDRLLVLPRRRRRDGRSRCAGDRRLRRFDHRRHRLDHEWRRPLAGRPRATAARRLRQPRRGGERRHRRQPGRRPARILAREAVPRRAVGRSAARSRRHQPLRRLDLRLARGHQRLQPERQRRRRGGRGRHAGRRGAAARARYPASASSARPS